MMTLSNKQWLDYERDGYLKLGHVLNHDALLGLQNRIDAIMLGQADIDYDQLLMQLDSSDGNLKNAGAQTLGFKGTTRNYRKIQGLEQDALFLEYIQAPIFRDMATRVYGVDTPIAAFRAMFMNKPAHQGSFLPWHQDRWSHLDRDPLLTVWTALDPATRSNGCVQVVAGSHKRGLLNPDHPSGFVSPEQAEEIMSHNEILHLELEAGEAVLLHNWLLHASDANTTSISRRAFSVCYMDARTMAANGEEFPAIFTPTAAPSAPTPLR